MADEATVEKLRKVIQKRDDKIQNLQTELARTSRDRNDWMRKAQTLPADGQSDIVDAALHNAEDNAAIAQARATASGSSQTSEQWPMSNTEKSKLERQLEVLHHEQEEWQKTQQDLEYYKQMADELQSSLVHANNTLDDTEAKLSEKDNEISTLHAETEKLRAEVQRLNILCDISDIDSSITIQAPYPPLQSNATSAEAAELEQLRGECEQLRGECEQLRSRCDHLDSSLTETTKELIELQSNDDGMLERAHKEETHHTQQLRTMKKRCEDLQVINDRLQAEKLVMQEEHQREQATAQTVLNEILEGTFTSAPSARTDLPARDPQNREIGSAFADEPSLITKNVDQCRYSAMQEEMEEHRKRMQEDYQSLNLVVQGLRNENHELKQTIIHCESQLAQLQEENEGLLEQRNQFLEENKELADKLEQMSREYKLRYKNDEADDDEGCSVGDTVVPHHSYSLPLRHATSDLQHDATLQHEPHETTQDHATLQPQVTSNDEAATERLKVENENLNKQVRDQHYELMQLENENYQLKQQLQAAPADSDAFTERLKEENRELLRQVSELQLQITQLEDDHAQLKQQKVELQAHLEGTLAPSPITNFNVEKLRDKPTPMEVDVEGPPVLAPPSQDAPYYCSGCEELEAKVANLKHQHETMMKSKNQQLTQQEITEAFLQKEIESLKAKLMEMETLNKDSVTDNKLKVGEAVDSLNTAADDSSSDTPSASYEHVTAENRKSQASVTDTLNRSIADDSRADESGTESYPHPDESHQQAADCSSSDDDDYCSVDGDSQLNETESLSSSYLQVSLSQSAMTTVNMHDQAIQTTGQPRNESLWVDESCQTDAVMIKDDLGATLTGSSDPAEVKNTERSLSEHDPVDNRVTELELREIEVQQLKAQVTQLRCQLANYERSHGQQSADAQQLDDSHQSAHEHAEQLKAENASLLKKLATLDSDKSILSANSTTLTEEVAYLQASLTAAQTENARIQHEAAQTAIAGTQNDSTSMLAQKARLEQQNASLLAEKTRIEQQNTALNADISGLQSEKAEMKSRLNKMERDGMEMRRESDELNKRKYVELEKERLNLEESYLQLEKEKEELQAEIVGKDEHLHKLREELQKVSSANDELQQQTHSEQSYISEMKQTVTHLEGEIKRLKDDKRSVRMELAEQREEFEDLEQQYQDCMRERNRAQQARTALENELARLQAQLTALVRRNEQQEQQSRERAQQDQEQIQMLQLQIETNTEDFRKEKDDRARIEKMNKDLKSIIDQRHASQVDLTHTGLDDWPDQATGSDRFDMSASVPNLQMERMQGSSSSNIPMYQSMCLQPTHQHHQAGPQHQHNGTGGANGRAVPLVNAAAALMEPADVDPAGEFPCIKCGKTFANDGMAQRHEATCL